MADKKWKFLLVNDDGIQSDGLVRLAAEAAKWGEVWVVAPDGQRSACSHSLTIDAPLDVLPYSFPPILYPCVYAPLSPGIYCPIPAKGMPWIRHSAASSISS